MTYQERAAYAQESKRQMVRDWAERYGVLLSKILFDDTISVIEKVKRLEEYKVPMPTSTQSYRWSRASVYKWMRDLHKYL